MKKVLEITNKQYKKEKKLKNVILHVFINIHVILFTSSNWETQTILIKKSIAENLFQLFYVFLIYQTITARSTARVVIELFAMKWNLKVSRAIFPLFRHVTTWIIEYPKVIWAYDICRAIHRKFPFIVNSYITRKKYSKSLDESTQPKQNQLCFHLVLHLLMAQKIVWWTKLGFHFQEEEYQNLSSD